ncbi:MAG: hypothetical protein JWO62_315 [Acidimicrobiaceae bacterium]|nr:hypothetical protein [Acidimicrobiaceae bacterium]
MIRRHCAHRTARSSRPAETLRSGWRLCMSGPSGTSICVAGDSSFRPPRTTPVWTLWAIRISGRPSTCTSLADHRIEGSAPRRRMDGGRRREGRRSHDNERPTRRPNPRPPIHNAPSARRAPPPRSWRRRTCLGRRSDTSRAQRDCRYRGAMQQAARRAPRRRSVLPLVARATMYGVPFRICKGHRPAWQITPSKPQFGSSPDRVALGIVLGATEVPLGNRHVRLEIATIGPVSDQTGKTLAEVGFLLILFAGVWLVTAQIPASP